MLKTPISLFGKALKRLKVGKKYHSGKITEGVANGLAGSPKPRGSMTASPMTSWKNPKMTIGKMYKISFGQLAKPIMIPLDHTKLWCHGN